MNIFFLSPDPKQCAQWHCDKHVVKMILEYSQLLSTAHRFCKGNVTDTYKATHVNHPSAVWARDNIENYYWLFDLLCALHTEYEFRYEKIHKSKRLLPILMTPPLGISGGPFYAPIQAMPDEYKVPTDSVAAYRNYYKNAKTHLHVWTKRPKPDWI